jgi:NAD(P)-dependent dehydrogenase (short-subunit alcohol dehydrogenase family)
MSAAGLPAQAAAVRPLAGRSALVTGAGDLARAIACAARDRGALVGLAGPGAEDDGLRASVHWFRSAPESEADVEGLFDRVALRLPRLDVVIAVVAADPLPPVPELTLAAWREAISVPLRRAFWLARRAVEGFLGDAVDGRLVLVAEPSRNGESPNHVITAALHSFARSFAREYGRRALACNVVVPGPVPVGLTRPLIAAVIEHALFLASPGASFVNGETVMVRHDVTASMSPADARA